MEEALRDWSADPTQSDDADHARRVLRGMVLTLAGVARDGLADPRHAQATPSISTGVVVNAEYGAAHAC